MYDTAERGKAQCGCLTAAGIAPPFFPWYVHTICLLTQSKPQTIIFFENISMPANDTVKKQTLYLICILALIAGFLLGVAYSAYRAPAVDAGLQTHADTNAERIRILAGLEKAAREHPDDFNAWVELAHGYADTGENGKAMEAYDRALKLRPGDADTMTDFGVACHQAGQHERALALFDDVLRIRPEHMQARFNKGVVLLVGLNRPEEALAEWKTLLRYHPDAAAPSGQGVAELVRQMEARVSGQPGAPGGK